MPSTSGSTDGGSAVSFDFLGFTHICGKSGSGRFKLRRVTQKKRMREKLHEVKAELRRRMHLPIPDQGRWLRSVLQGHFNYYAVPGNSEALIAYRYQAMHHWRRSLSRRSQRAYVTWGRMDHIATRWLPPVRILHPWPEVRLHGPSASTKACCQGQRAVPVARPYRDRSL